MIPAMTEIRVAGLAGQEDGARIRKALESLPGILRIDLAEQEGIVQVTYDSGALPEHAIHGTIESAGYTTEK